MLKNVIALCAATTAIVTATGAKAAEIHIQTSNPVVELSVAETIASAPDTALFSTGITTVAPTASEALRQNSEAVRTMLKKIQELGIKDKDVQTSGINLNAEYEWVEANQSQRFKGYRVYNTVSVKVRDIDKLGKILDGVVSAGANNLNGPTFFVEKDDGLKAKARASALSRGKAQATEYARAAGYKDVRLLSVAESISDDVSDDVMQLRKENEPAATDSAPVAPGQVNTSVVVSMQFEMVK